MTSDPSNYHREYSPYGSYSLFQFEGSDVISAEYSFVLFKCLMQGVPKDFPLLNKNTSNIVKLNTGFSSRCSTGG